MGLIGTDMICADEIASRVADKSNALFTPPSVSNNLYPSSFAFRNASVLFSPANKLAPL